MTNIFVNKPEAFPNGLKMVTLSAGTISRYKIFVNVGDMEYSGGDERIAFGPMAKGQKKYGATSSRFKKPNEPVVVYNVQLGDTMQGLAVKFGVTTEQIRRANNLWTNDSLFLRDKLLIPVVGGANGGGGTNGQDGSSGSQQGECSSRTSCSDTEADLTSSLDNENDGSLPQCLQRLDSDNGSRSSRTHNSNWSHPLCDEYLEQRDCRDNWENCEEEEVGFGGESLNFVGGGGGPHASNHPHSSSNSHPVPLGSNGASNNSTGGEYEEDFEEDEDEDGEEEEEEETMFGDSSPKKGKRRGNLPSSSSIVSATNGHVVLTANNSCRPDSSMSNGTLSNPLSPTSQSSGSRIVDYSEKSAKDFLSRIDSAIASSRIRAKSKESKSQHGEQSPWVTFDSDGESSDHRHSGSGTSITTQGRHLRYSLRKLEKAQDELFQL